jgi:hypothetical protein
MPQPTRGDVHVVRSLTNIAVAAIQSASDFVATQVFPAVPVEFQSDSYFKYRSRDFRRNNARPRAPGAESAGSGFNVDTDTYKAEVYAFHHDVPDQIRNNADPSLDMDRSATEFITQQMLIQKEVNWGTKYFTTSVWGTDKTGSTDFALWDDGGSDPEADIDAGKTKIRKALGLNPNTLVVGYDVHQALKRHPIITDRYKHTTSDAITTALLARFFEVDRYIVAQASYTTSEELAATDVDAFVLGKHALLCFVAPSPGLMVPSAGYSFTWSKFSGANGGVRVKRFRMEHLESDRVEGEFSYDQKVVMTDAGYFFSGAVA